MLQPSQYFSLWGQVFEIAVKRGVLVSLLNSRLQWTEMQGLEVWKKFDTGDVYAALAQELKEVDPNLKAYTKTTARHLFQIGLGLGQTAMREYLRNLERNSKGHDLANYRIQALWCPLQLPRDQSHYEREGAESITEFWATFGITGTPDRSFLGKGYSARADFLLWLIPDDNNCPHELLCLEFSLNAFRDSADYSQPTPHLAELRRYARFIDSRSVFSQICAEVDGEGFAFSPQLKEHLHAFTARDKPLFKLCQAASYIDKTLKLLDRHKLIKQPCNARAFAITQNGFESLSAQFFRNDIPDPRCALMATLGEAYRKMEKSSDVAEVTEDYIAGVFKHIRKALPKNMREQLRQLEDLPLPNESVALSFTETLSDFCHPMTALNWDDTQNLIDSNDALTAFFKQDARAALAAALPENLVIGEPISLRDLHASAVIAGLNAAELGKLTVLGLEGNPGIGKTTAVTRYLRKLTDGFLFLYVSPRVIINDDVTSGLARKNNTLTGILTVTTNSKLISSAQPWHDAQVNAGLKLACRIDGAVVADGIVDLQYPNSSILILNPELKEEVERTQTGSRTNRNQETKQQARITDHPLPGVLKVLAKTSRALLEENPTITQLVLTAAIQSYRELGESKSTVDGLTNLFQHQVNTRPGLRERREFAARIPIIVVMVDELTGDPAGVLVIDALARWLNEQFIRPFKDAPYFRVVLIVSDASLGNEVVLDRYLSSSERAPSKILVTQSGQKRPFRLTVTEKTRFAGAARSVLHVMTNSYPATQLTIDYRVRLDVIPFEAQQKGIRHAISEQQNKVLIDNILHEIERALAANAHQVIFFAQDKAFLRLVKNMLITGAAALQRTQIAIIDSSVPAAERKALIEEELRDQIKVFLMTSSGARGVSFPKTDWIIALMPRFGIESSLMEVAQLIYRGRGQKYKTDNRQEAMDGDTKNRNLVLLLQDFLPQETKPEPRQWLRQISDLLTFIVLLRATIHTRITGDAGLDKQRLAVVPVGNVGSEDMLTLMSTQVRIFLSESAVLMSDKHAHVDQKSLIKAAQLAVTNLFSKFSLEATGRKQELRSVVRPSDLEQFSISASADHAPLLLNPTDSPACVLHENQYCVGPFWLEQWKEVDKTERFSFETWITAVSEQIETLLNQLWRIHKDQKLPRNLRTAAEELHRILKQEQGDVGCEFSTVKTLSSDATWLAVPVDYPRFFQPSNGQIPALGDESLWRDALGRCLSVQREVMPVIPRYAGIPYAAVAGIQDPARFEQIFDDRYIAASNELNLLNSILLEE
ncbi:helicase C-terminal domain-containing protein [Chromatium okenii]|uniref:helicase C-terminal domain-containing protein n=1 Tax=Chromatium okenii TaxID=61644 RepID=UPI0026F33B85|nr:helicase C-terminal domain-containing protein [Chromatium okenii]MBV5310035.1 hypothetical protein [Chromatium okenii]